MAVASIDEASVRSYYDAALIGLRYLEKRRPTGRRFGPNADARWASFQGDLTTADRIDLLIRDADLERPQTFGARGVFDLDVAEDDPFGPGWPSLPPIDAETVWRQATNGPPPETVADALRAIAAAWGIRLSGFDPIAVNPADKLLIAGPSAVIAAATAFAEGQDLDWTDQVVCIATPPAHRQLAAVAGALVGTTHAYAVFARRSDNCELYAGSPDLCNRRPLISSDADTGDGGVVQHLTGEGRGGAL